MVFNKLHTFGGLIGLEIVNTHRFCLMARLLLLRENNQTSDSEWEEFKASKTTRKEDMKEKKFEVAARFTKWLCHSNISEHEIVDLLYSVIPPLHPASARSDKIQMQNKLIVIKLPILRDFCEYDPVIPTLLRAGLTFDPFVSKIAHSCSPNAQCVSEGQELRVRTLQPLKAGDEITFRWEHEDTSSHSVGCESHGRELGLGIYVDSEDSGCGICPQDPRTPTGDLGDHALQLSKLVISSDPHLISKISKSSFKRFAQPGWDTGLLLCENSVNLHVPIFCV